MTLRWAKTGVLQAIILVVAVTVAAAAETPSAICPIVEDAPDVDGALDDAVWAESKVYGPLLTARTGSTVAEPEMTFRTVTDGTSLFFGCEVTHPNPAELADVPVEKDEVTIFKHDTVEIFLAPDAKEAAYYHFAFGPTGSVWDTHEQQGAGDYNYPLQHAASIGDDGWTLEVAIPLAELGLPDGVEQGHTMALNVCREAHGTGADEPLQAWSPTGGFFHNRGIFGELLIGTYEGAVNWRVGKLRELHGQAAESAGERAAEELAFWRDRLADLKQRGPALASAEDWQSFQSAARQAESEIRRLGLGGEGLFVYEVSPWQLPSSTSLPDPGVDELQTLAPVALEGEWTTSAFAIANTLAEPVRVQVKMTDLLSAKMDRQVSAAERVRICEAVEVGLLGGGQVRDALPPLSESHHVVVPSGRNGVVWATVDTRGLEPGTWILGIKLMPLKRPELARSLRMKLEVLPAALPDGPRPYSFNWYRYDRYPSKPYPEATARDLKEHFNNIVGVQIGWPEFDEEGNVTKEIDFSEVEREIERHGTDGRHYLIRHFYRWFPGESLGNETEWTDAQQRNFEYTVRAVREFFESKGLTVEDFSWYVDDEPSSVERAELVAAFGRRMEQADPEQRRWVTVYGAVTREALETMVPWVNLWVPKFSLNEWQQELVHSRRDEGVRYFSYSVLSKSAGAYWHYRLDSWRALERGYDGVGFWNYNDTGGPNKTAWDDTDGTKSDYSVVYRGADGPTSSARWEAHRHGVQDYRIYEWVRELAREHADTEAGREAAEYVDGAIAEVLGNRERDTADRVVSRLRELGLAVLKETGELPADAMPEQRDLPVCLTANCGYLTPSLDTAGFYTYNSYPSPDHHGEACRVTEGPVYFEARHATEGPQSENQLDGDLTDENIYYPTGYAIWFWPPSKITVTFDFRAPYRLSHALMRFDPIETQGVTVWISTGDGEDDWRQVDANSGADPRLGWQDDLAFDLGDEVAQRVRFEVDSAKEPVRLGEVRIWGWPTE
ncbi:MAG: sugar-binding protein [Armatimonadota bacterium]